MATDHPHQQNKAIRIARAHARLLVSVALGLVVSLLSIGTGATALKAFLIGWAVGIAVYLVRTVVVIHRFDIEQVKRRAASQDEGGVMVLVLTVIAAAASTAAIFAQLEAVNTSGAPSTGAHFALAVVTILLSWIFIHTIFAFHYAHEYYGEGRDGVACGGLLFPQDEQNQDNKPDYWDFVYFSFVLGMTFQVSDVQITSKVIRRLAAAHGFIAFIFNVAILALIVNIGGNILNK